MRLQRYKTTKNQVISANNHFKQLRNDEFQLRVLIQVEACDLRNRHQSFIPFMGMVILIHTAQTPKVITEYSLQFYNLRWIHLVEDWNGNEFAFVHELFDLHQRV